MLLDRMILHNQNTKLLLNKVFNNFRFVQFRIKVINELFYKFYDCFRFIAYFDSLHLIYFLIVLIFIYLIFIYLMLSSIPFWIPY